MNSALLKSIIVTTLALALNACAPAGYGSNAGYFALDPEVAEANRQNTHRIEQEGNDIENTERMRRARATEVATRNNPTSVTTNRTSFWFW